MSDKEHSTYSHLQSILKNNKGFASAFAIIVTLSGFGGYSVTDTATKFNKLIENSSKQTDTINELVKSNSKLEKRQTRLINAINNLNKQQITIEDLANVHKEISKKNPDVKTLDAKRISELVMQRKIKELAERGILNFENDK